MTLKRKKVDVSRINGSAGWNHWKLLWVAALACPVMACKSTGPVGPSEPSNGRVECPAILPAETALTYSLSCTDFTPTHFRVTESAPVTFKSECDHEVIISFSDPSTLFTSGVRSITLKSYGEQTETVSKEGGCHEMCFGSPTCPPPEDRGEKTGSLDVYTSGGPGPEPKKPMGE